MKNHTVILVYTAYAFIDVEAENKEEAIEQAWYKFEKNTPETRFGEWEVSDVEEAE